MHLSNLNKTLFLSFLIFLLSSCSEDISSENADIKQTSDSVRYEEKTIDISLNNLDLSINYSDNYNSQDFYKLDSTYNFYKNNDNIIVDFKNNLEEEIKFEDDKDTLEKYKNYIQFADNYLSDIQTFANNKEEYKSFPSNYYTHMYLSLKNDMEYKDNDESQNLLSFIPPFPFKSNDGSVDGWAYGYISSIKNKSVLFFITNNKTYKVTGDFNSPIHILLSSVENNIQNNKTYNGDLDRVYLNDDFIHNELRYFANANKNKYSLYSGMKSNDEYKMFIANYFNKINLNISEPNIISKEIVPIRFASTNVPFIFVNSIHFNDGNTKYVMYEKDGIIYRLNLVN